MFRSHNGRMLLVKLKNTFPDYKCIYTIAQLYFLRFKHVKLLNINMSYHICKGLHLGYKMEHVGR